MENFDFDTLQTIADALAGIFGTLGGATDWLVNTGGTVIGWLISGVQWLIGIVSGWIAK